MRKQALLSAFFILLAFSGFSGKAGLPDIRKVALAFFHEHSGQAAAYTPGSTGIRSIQPTSCNGHVVYYTIRMDPKGWIVVSADDAVTPVLAYSFEDNLEGGTMPPQYISWMQKYQKAIDQVITENLPAAPGAREKWARYLDPDPGHSSDLPQLSGTGPLIIHNWDQGYPYNILCPEDPAGPGSHPYAGCVATAMCQVMYYYRFPATGKGQHCYTPSGYTQQCADFGATAYNWNAMVNSLTGARLENDTAVALLLWHAGVSVDMMYSAGGSGAYSEDARNSLVSNFRYSPSAQYIHRDDFQESAWDSILKANLDRKMPMYYDGYAPTVGHAFNCDGYQGDDHFHFNWGWSGTANGYYYLNNLNPAGYNFSSGEGAIVNLFPDTTANTYPYICQSGIQMHSVSGTFDDGSGPALPSRPGNHCSWLISPQSSDDSVQSITIAFNTFSTKEGSSMVRVYKGGSTSDTLAGSFSGSSLPPSITVYGPKALVTYDTPSSDPGDGWMISYTGKPVDWCMDARTITDSAGTISDGSLHFNYHNSTSCRWKIIPENVQGPVSLTFKSFRTQKNHDFVRIYDYVTGQPLAEYSGIYSGSVMPPPVIAPSGQMFVMFSTDQTVTEQGWEASFSTVLGCDQPAGLTDIRLFPNPASDKIFISEQGHEVHILRIEISGMNGTVVLDQDVSETVSRTGIDISGLSAGLYFVRVTTDLGSSVMKLIRE